MATKNLYILDANGETSIVGGDADGRASDALKLGGKAPEYYIQPRNLLDNSDFTNPVNQRGQTSYSGAKYGIDRWTGRGATASLDVDDGCITFKTTGSGVYLDCWLPVGMIKDGATYTVALQTLGGELGVASGVASVDMGTSLIAYNIDDGQGERASVRMEYNPNKGLYRVSIGTSSTNGVQLEWAALYEGAYTLDTLPPYVPKGYAVELNECKRYYYQTWYDTKISENGIVMTIAGSTTSSHTFQLPAEMRITPTITLYSFTDGTANAVVPWGGSTLANVVASNVCNRNFRIQSTGSKFTANKSYAFHFCASADL